MFYSENNNFTDIIKTSKNKLCWKRKGDMETVKLHSDVSITNKRYFKILYKIITKNGKIAFIKTLAIVI